MCSSDLRKDGSLLIVFYSLGNTKGSVIFMTLDTGTEIAREKFHLLPMPDVVVSHLSALAAKDRKIISKEPSFLCHGLDVSEETPKPDLEDEIFYPLSTEETSPTPADSSHPPDNYDSSNHRGGEQTETEEYHITY